VADLQTPKLKMQLKKRVSTMSGKITLEANTVDCIQPQRVPAKSSLPYCFLTETAQCCQLLQHGGRFMHLFDQKNNVNLM
jgi:hypothetical protein